MNHKSSPSTQKSVKFYKQAYRVEWESMPDFKGWLKPVTGQPSRAFCTYCDKTLHAHRLSLLKHTCTIKHSNSAMKSYSRQTTSSSSSTVGSETATKIISAIKPDPLLEADPVVEQFEITQVVPSEEDMNEDEVLHQSDADRDIQEGIDDSESTPVAKVPRLEMAAVSEYPISTHILDTSKGNPVAGLHVSLYKLIDGRWTSISEGITSPDGRYTEFIKRKDFTAGRYKMHFDVDRYFELRRVESLYPFIEIVFDVAAPMEHYHVPLLLSPFGYTTYRGS